jgi:hypothetical protein
MIVVSFLSFLSLARAGDPLPPEPAVVAPSSVPAETAWHAARRPELLGASCAASTGMAARRVVEEGTEWTALGTLEPSPDNMDIQVSAPFQVRGTETKVVATALAEQVVQNRLLGRNLVLVGRSLSVEGVTYVVLMSYRAP